MLTLQILLALFIWTMLKYLTRVPNIIKEYIKQNTYGVFRMDWFLYRVLEDFISKKMAKRFYEAKTHLQNGWCFSFLNMLGIVTSVRFDIGYPSGYSVYCWTFGTFNPNSKRGEKILNKLANKNIKNDEYYTDCLVAGYNII